MQPYAALTYLLSSAHTAALWITPTIVSNYSSRINSTLIHSNDKKDLGVRYPLTAGCANILKLFNYRTICCSKHGTIVFLSKILHSYLKTFSPWYQDWIKQAVKVLLNNSINLGCNIFIEILLRMTCVENVLTRKLPLGPGKWMTQVCMQVIASSFTCSKNKKNGTPVCQLFQCWKMLLVYL